MIVSALFRFYKKRKAFNMETTENTTSVEKKFRLYEFAYLGKDEVFSQRLATLKDLAMPEEWDWQTSSSGGIAPENSILRNYIQYTFNRIKEEFDAATTEEERQRKIATSEQHACFNTGLFTKNYAPIFMAFEKNTNVGRQPWYLKSFFSGSVPKEFADLALPERANYFARPEELIYDYHLPIRVDVDHVFREENFERFPENIRKTYSSNVLRNLFNGAVIETERKLASNYKLAIPQYYNGNIQLLVPIDLENKGQADLALAMFNAKDCYSARTCLTLEMAYNNARLIVKPESEWLHP